jgi:site-specific recombinase XerD
MGWCLMMEATMKEPRWVRRWNSWIAPTPSKPGVWRRKEGGYLARGRAKDPRTGKLREVKLTLPDGDVLAGYLSLQEDLKKVREGSALEQVSAPITFAEFSVSLLERKVRSGEIKSFKGREKWGYMLKLHLLPFFGPFLLDQIRRADVERWKDELACLIHAGKLKPGTANDRLSTLKVIINTAVAEYELERNPVLGAKDFDTSTHPAYTEEEPNSLSPSEVPAFLAVMRTRFPQHFAMTVLGFATGLRPSSLRPLRGKGPKRDLLWEEQVLLVRRSHTRTQEVMETTKTGLRQRLRLPAELMEILRWHVAHLPEGKMQESNLLFPSTTGGLMAASTLDKPFQEVVKKLELKKKITPRAMRRTFQDLARAAEVKDIVTRAISGHVTEVMQRHYSTVQAEEITSCIAKVVSLAKVKEAMAAKGSPTEPEITGDDTPENGVPTAEQKAS